MDFMKLHRTINQIAEAGADNVEIFTALSDMLGVENAVNIWGSGKFKLAYSVNERATPTEIAMGDMINKMVCYGIDADASHNIVAETKRFLCELSPVEGTRIRRILYVA